MSRDRKYVRLSSGFDRSREYSRTGELGPGEIEAPYAIAFGGLRKVFGMGIRLSRQIVSPQTIMAEPLGPATIAMSAGLPLLCSEAIEQPVSTRAAQIALAAAAVRPARRMR